MHFKYTLGNYAQQVSKTTIFPKCRNRCVIVTVAVKVYQL